MKNKILFSFVSAFALFTIIAGWGERSNATKRSENSLPLTLKISSEKQAYLQGEIVKLNFELLNESQKAIRLPYRPDVSTGFLSVWIAFSDGKFNQYNNSSWGRMEYSGLILQPGQSFESQATIIWNNKPRTSHLNADAAKRASEGKILTDYSFPEAGVYMIKGITNIIGDNPMKIESDPIQIVINEPVGDDLKVWNQIKNNGNITYFIQQGSTPTYQDEKAEKLIKEIEQISKKYPDSLLASQMKEKLEKFRVDEKRIKESLEKAMVKQKN